MDNESIVRRPALAISEGLFFCLGKGKKRAAEPLGYHTLQQTNTYTLPVFALLVSFRICVHQGIHKGACDKEAAQNDDELKHAGALLFVSQSLYNLRGGE